MLFNLIFRVTGCLSPGILPPQVCCLLCSQCILSFNYIYDSTVIHRDVSDYLLLGVVRQAGAGSKHWPVVLDGETFQLGPESLLLLRHHTVSSTLKTEGGSVLMWRVTRMFRLSTGLHTLLPVEP